MCGGEVLSPPSVLIPWILKNLGEGSKLQVLSKHLFTFVFHYQKNIGSICQNCIFSKNREVYLEAWFVGKLLISAMISVSASSTWFSLRKVTCTSFDRSACEGSLDSIWIIYYAKKSSMVKFARGQPADQCSTNDSIATSGIYTPRLGSRKELESTVANSNRLDCLRR